MSLPSFQTVLARAVAATGATAGTILCLVAVLEPDLGIATVSSHAIVGTSCASSSARVGCDAA